MEYIFDTNIWIYLLEGRKEVKVLKKKIKKAQVVPILTPVIFAEVLEWNELGEEQEHKRLFFFSSNANYSGGRTNKFRWRQKSGAPD